MYITTLINFDYQLKSLTCREVRLYKEDANMEASFIGSFNKTSVMLKEHELGGVNIDYSLIEYEPDGYDSDLLDTFSKAEAIEIEHSDIMNFPTNRTFGHDFQSYFHKKDDYLTQAYVVRKLDKVDFEHGNRKDEAISDESRKRYKDIVWKKINNSGFKKFVGDYRFKWLKEKYSK